MALPCEIGLAAAHGELQPVLKWLQMSGNVDALDENGHGLLHATALGERLRLSLHVAKELLQRGASVDLRAPAGGNWGGNTALMMAAMMDRHAMVRLLLEHKASIDLQSGGGVTALMMAANEGHTECVRELLEAGASTELCDQLGRTALQVAEKVQHAERNAATAELLRQQPATPASVANSLPRVVGLAAGRGELQPVVKWLQKGGNVDALDESGIGLLHAAAGGVHLPGGQHLRVAKELLKRGARVDLRGVRHLTALLLAAMKGRHAMVRLLLEHKASIDLQNVDSLTALMLATSEGCKECAQELLGAGASTELRDKAGRTALQLAEMQGHAAIAKLLRHHATTPPATVAMALPHELSLAARRGELQPVVEWLQKGGHVDALNENKNGLLHAAAEGQHLSLAKELLQRGASVDLRDPKGNSALIVAAGQGYPGQGLHAMVRLLLEHKASVDLQNTAGHTTLMVAAASGCKENVQELLKAGASIELRSQKGHTVMQGAELSGYPIITKLLQQHKAKLSTASSKTVLTAEALAAAEAAADRAAEELLAEEGAPETSKGKKKKKKGGGAASAASTATSLDPKPPADLSSAVEPATATPTPSARELATAVLQQAIDVGELEPIRKAIGMHATAADGTDVLKEARTLRDRLAEQQRKAAKEAKLAGKREQKRREGEGRAVIEAEAAVVAAAERAEAEARAAAEEQAAAERSASERAAAAKKKRVAAERAAAERTEEDAHLDEALARSMASLQADEERRRASAASVAPSLRTAPIAPPPPPTASAAVSDDAVAHLRGQASLQVPAGSSDAAAAAAPMALSRPPPPPPAAVTSLADAQFSTGRSEAAESTIGGQTTCIVCFINPKSHLAAPCGHQCACGDCSAQMKECPVCRVPVSMWMQVRVA